MAQIGGRDAVDLYEALRAQFTLARFDSLEAIVGLVKSTAAPDMEHSFVEIKGGRSIFTGPDYYLNPRRIIYNPGVKYIPKEGSDESDLNYLKRNNIQPNKKRIEFWRGFSCPGKRKLEWYSSDLVLVDMLADKPIVDMIHASAARARAGDKRAGSLYSLLCKYSAKVSIGKKVPVAFPVLVVVGADKAEIEILNQFSMRNQVKGRAVDPEELIAIRDSMWGTRLTVPS